MKKKILYLAIFFILFSAGLSTLACTGISFRAANGDFTVARTIEWGGSELPSLYVIVPRGTEFVSLTPEGENGLKFKAKYGSVGLAVVQKEFIMEGLNEAGLSAGLFYFPGYGKYPEFDTEKRKETLADLQVVAWILSRFATVDEVREAMPNIRVVAIEGTETVHWRVADSSGRQIVIEIVDGETRIYDNTVGVLTNSPGFEWHLTNLNNYVNLNPGAVETKEMSGRELRAFGAGAGFTGLPGDVTPPSRFVRAFFFQSTAPVQPDGKACILQSFHILNNFDIPIGVEFKNGEAPNIPSATQWTTATDLRNRRIYYRSMYNSTIRCIDLNTIDFNQVSLTSAPLDEIQDEPVTLIRP